MLKWVHIWRKLKIIIITFQKKAYFHFERPIRLKTSIEKMVGEKLVTKTLKPD